MLRRSAGVWLKINGTHTLGFQENDSEFRNPNFQSIFVEKVYKVVQKLTETTRISEFGIDFSKIQCHVCGNL
jgi:hypothetical protein